MFAKCPLSAGMLTPLITSHLVVLVVTVFDNEFFFCFFCKQFIFGCVRL